MDLRVNMTSTASHYAEQCTVILATNQLWKARLCGEIRLWQHRQVLCRHSGDDCPVLGADRKKLVACVQYCAYNCWLFNVHVATYVTLDKSTQYV